LGLRGARQQGSGEDYITRSFKICTDKSEQNEMCGACGSVNRRGAYRVLVEETYRKRQLGVSRHRWHNDIKMCLQEVVCGTDRNGCRWRGLVNAVKNFRVS
jgi:hypothetical protein